jgi:hypothetical protein
MLVGLALLILLVEAARHHRTEEATLLLATMAAAVFAADRLLRDFRAHPANFPTPTAAHGLGMQVTGADGQRAVSDWASQTRREDA